MAPSAGQKWLPPSHGSYVWRVHPEVTLPCCWGNHWEGWEWWSWCSWAGTNDYALRFDVIASSRLNQCFTSIFYVWGGMGKGTYWVQRSSVLVFQVSQFSLIQHQNSVPDVIIWMLAGNKRVAVKRIPSHLLMYSKTAKARGKLCGKVQTIFLTVGHYTSCQ